ncbi:MAG: tRNA 2-thiouridine(34) synthase MnmA [Odoribacteraceae bacterium]|jgi:tRNA-specific 2-thiouridylase|nr:tRNA 2-thiouridine(34) synthase MnmA [Odoribacteraceae bacterium]
MGRNKLAKFAEMERLPNVIQPAVGGRIPPGFELRGRWSERVFGNDHPLVLEVGCGKGEYTVGLAGEFPGTNFIGVDIKGARMWSGATAALERGLKNVAFLRVRAEMLASIFAPGEVAGIWITFPDPQMGKARKRLTGSRFLSLYREILVAGGEIHLKTDSPFLFHYTRSLLEANGLPCLEETDDLHAGQRDDCLQRVRTFYERQWLSRGKTIKYLRFTIDGQAALVEPAEEPARDDYRSEARYMLPGRPAGVPRRRVLVAMSGGVDSTVAAILLKEQGYEVEGVTYRVYDQISSGCLEKERGCCSVDALFEAKRVAERLGFEHHLLDLRDYFRETVIRDFIDGYLRGRTPNPCVPCNALVKWGKLIEMADALHCERIATGHYARVARAGSRYFLREGVDATKDQTYFLWPLTRDNLARTLFPLGELTKPEARAIALERGFERLSRKSESQEICFIPGDDYRAFLAERVDDFAGRYGPGWFVDTAGRRLGRHQGYPRYTIGQRKRLGIALGHPAFVVAIRPAENEVVLGPREELRGNEFRALQVNWMKYPAPRAPREAIVKIRYRDRGAAATLYPGEEGRLRVVFRESVEAITPGQSAVFYEGRDVIGGGIIE